MSKPTGGRFIDLTNQVFGNLTVIDFSHTRKNKAYWICKCNCGHDYCNYNIIAMGVKLRDGRVSGCGIKSNSHYQSDIPEYAIWSSMKQRCENPNSKDFVNYGGRGISYDKNWEFFQNFIHDMGFRLSNKYSLERIDNNKDYCKDNCKWAEKSQQNTNQRRSVGCFFNKKSNKWVSAISKDRIKYYLGYFESKEEAIQAYKAKKKELYGI